MGAVYLKHSDVWEVWQGKRKVYESEEYGEALAYAAEVRRIQKESMASEAEKEEH